MQRTWVGLLLMMLLAACGTTPTDSEGKRELVLQYLGTDVGTAGPFYKSAHQEIAVLSNADRRKAEALIEDGAALFLIFQANAAVAPNATRTADRLIFVQKGEIVGDFRPQPKA